MSSRSYAKKEAFNNDTLTKPPKLSGLSPPFFVEILKAGHFHGGMDRLLRSGLPGLSLHCFLSQPLRHDATRRTGLNHEPLQSRNFHSLRHLCVAHPIDPVPAPTRHSRPRRYRIVHAGLYHLWFAVPLSQEPAPSGGGRQVRRRSTAAPGLQQPR